MDTIPRGDRASRPAWRDGGNGIDATFRYTSIAQLVTDLDGRCLFANDAFTELTGYAAQQLHGMHVSDLAPDRLFEVTRRRLERDGEERRPSSGEGVLLAADGDCIPVWQTIWTVADDEGQPSGFMLEAHDLRQPQEAQLALKGLIETERQLRISERQLVAAERIARTGSAVWDLKTDQFIPSPGLARMFAGAVGSDLEGGTSLEQALELVHPDDVDRVRRLLAERRTGSDGEGDFRVVSRSGRELTMHARAVAEADEHGEPVRVHITVLDITDRAAAERELRESEERFRTLVETSRSGISLVSPEGQILFVNEALADMYGYSAEELIGQYSATLVPTDERATLAQTRSEILDLDRPHSSHGVRERRDGTRFTVEAAQFPITLADGERAILTESRDISDRLTAEEALRTSEARYRSFFQNSHVGIARVRFRDGTLIDVNDRFAEMNGYASREEALADEEFAFKYVDPEAQRRVVRDLKEHGETLSEAWLRRRDGSLGFHQAHLWLVPGTEFVDGVSVDMTRERMLQEEVEESNARYRSFFQNSQAAIARVRLRDFKLLDANDQLARMLGYDDRAELLAEDFELDFVDPGVVEEAARRLIKDGVEVGEAWLRRRDGSEVLIRAHLWRVPDTEAVDAVAIDVTEERRLSDEVAASEARLSAVLDTVRSGVLLLDGEMRIKYMNRQLGEMIGLAPSESVGRTVSLDEWIVEEDRSRVSTGLTRMLSSTRVGAGVRARALKTDGTTFDIEIMGSPLSRGDEIVGAVFEVRDITLDLLAERDREYAQRAIVRTEFLATVSHELRTPLNSVLGYAGLLKQDSSQLSDRHQAYVGDILDAGEHLLSLINDILDISKIDAGRYDLELRELDLNATVADVTHQMRGLAEERGLELLMSAAAEQLCVTADERAVRQMLLNLVSNAIKFTPEGRVTVETALRDDIAVLAVRDTGPGIPHEHRDAVFEEFVQLGKATSNQDGTGLGLSIVRRLARLHGGDVTFEEPPGGGARFVLRLPVSGPDPARARIRRGGNGAH